MSPRNRISSLLLTLFIGLVGFSMFIMTLTPVRAVRAADERAIYSCFTSYNNTNTTAYSSADASAIQDAIDNASQDDLIKVAGSCVGVQNVNGYTQTVYLDEDLTLRGGYDESDWSAEPAADSRTTLDANNGGRVIFTPYDTFVESTIENFVIQNGDAFNNNPGTCGSSGPNGGGGVCIGSGVNITISNSIVQDNDAQHGGGIYRHGGGYDLTIIDSTIQNNRALTGYGGGIFQLYNSLVVIDSTIYNNLANAQGGGIYIDTHNLTVQGSTISNNTALSHGGGISADSGLLQVNISESRITNNDSGANGAGIYNKGLMWIESSTIDTNEGTELGGRAVNNGGGLFSSNQFTLTNVTVSGNTADNGGGIYADNTHSYINFSTVVSNTASGFGGGLYYSGGGRADVIPDVANSIFAYNSPSNCSGSVDYLSTSIEDDSSCGFSEGRASNTDPLLGPLADNGGPTPTHLPQIDSPAVNYVPSVLPACGTEVTVDQRGASRPQLGDRCDAGAVEVEALCYVEDDDPDDLTDYSSIDASALQDAVDAASPGDLLKVAGTCAGVEFNGTYTQTLYIDTPITIQGGYDPSDWTTHAPESYTTTLDAEGNGRVINFFNEKYSATLDSLVIQNGESELAGGSDYGGGIWISGSQTEVTLNNSLIRWNSSNRGGGILSTGTLTVTHSLFVENTAIPWAAGLYGNGDTYIGYSTFIDGLGSNGEGAFNGTSGTMLIENTTFINSEIHNRNVLTVTNSTISGEADRGFDTYQGDTWILFSTISENNDGIYSSVAGSAYYLKGVIVANSDNNNCSLGSGTLTDLGYNLEGEDDCGLTETTSITNTNPLLLDLGDYGGDTQTYMIVGGSPAMDHVPAGLCPAIDQRDVARPVNASCDIGAVEFNWNILFLPIVTR